MKLAAVAFLVSLNIGVALLCLVLDEGRVTMRAETVRERLSFALFWPWLLASAALFRADLLRPPKHADNCLSQFIRGCCDCPTQRGLVLSPPRSY